jgi:uncharacterized protein YndB with AHSA1/START domain
MKTAAAGKDRVTLERTYQASLDEIWEMWTTREGIESWWGPDGFAVTVKEIDLRPGGRLLYTMRAVAPEMLAFMKQQGMPPAHDAQLRFTEVVPRQRLAYLHLVDFAPGVEPYDVAYQVLFQPVAGGVRMTLTFDRMHDDTWTQRAVMGWENELAKLGRALAGRGARP